MRKPVLIMVTGLSATGKTTLSQKLAKSLQVPLISKDGLKETMFDSVGFSDREWSKKLGMASHHLLRYIIEQHLKAGCSLMIESPLSPEYEQANLQKWQKQYGFLAIQVLCHTEGKLLVRRFEERAATPDRHPGHVEVGGTLDELRPRLLKGKDDTLDLEGKIIEVDTTDFAKVDERAIEAKIRNAIVAPYRL